MVNIIHLSCFPPPPLSADNIHVYTTSLQDLPTDMNLSAYINDTEQERAQRFINPDHGKRFSQVRGLLRVWLGHYLAQPPQAVHFTYNRYGQPTVSSAELLLPLHFNISHSGNMAAFIFATTRVGIDIEFMKPMKNLDAMTRYIAHPKELAEFQQMNPQNAYEAFFRLWTRKEAYIKANGQGLSMGLRSIYIGTHTEKKIVVEYKNTSQPNWLIQDITAPENSSGAYKLAIAVEQSN